MAKKCPTCGRKTPYLYKCPICGGINCKYCRKTPLFGSIKCQFCDHPLSSEDKI
ncbi:MAG: hypothetical protein ACTSSG_09935 [Candidatus Heimdallarchaeaceae archaeon]